MRNENTVVVGKGQMATLPKIVAVDFDGTLVSDEFPAIGKPFIQNVEIVKQLKAKGVKVILWTSRSNDSNGNQLDEAVAFCKDAWGLEFDAVNENLREVQEMFGGDTRKIYADVYFDDKAVPHHQDPLYWVDRLGMTYSEYRK